MSEAMKAHWADPEFRARMVAIARRRWADPEWRRRQIAAMHAPLRLPAMNDAQRAEYLRLRRPHKGMNRGDALDFVLNPPPAREHAPMLCECCLKRLDPDTVYQAGPIELYPIRHEVTVDGAPVHMPPQEMSVLDLLLRRPGVIRTKAELFDAVAIDARQFKLVDVLVCRLRQRLGAHGGMIENVWGVGYRIAAAALESAAA